MQLAAIRLATHNRLATYSLIRLEGISSIKRRSSIWIEIAAHSENIRPFFVEDRIVSEDCQLK